LAEETDGYICPAATIKGCGAIVFQAVRNKDKKIACFLQPTITQENPTPIETKLKQRGRSGTAVPPDDYEYIGSQEIMLEF